MARVIVGGSFACDDAIARPLAALLRELPEESPTADVEWLPYGGAADLTSLDEPLRRARADLVVLLVRLSDLEAAHPELTRDQRAPTTSRPESAFVTQLQAYEAQATPPPPLVVLFCPSPPSERSGDHMYEAHEAAMRRVIEPLQHVSCRPSSDALAFFDADGSAVVDWYDATGEKREHAPFTASMLHVLALGCARQIARLGLRSAKKVVVLDCDNTLWGGAVADLGPARVELSERFLALQRFAVAQQACGVLLCLCSKNIPEDVDAVFRARASEMALRQHEHVVLSRVNWRAKSQNIREMAQQLKLGLEAFVFVDDNALECHEVATALPMVSVVRVPDDFGRNFLETQWVFDTPLAFRATEEDNERTKLYQQNAQRDEHERRATSQAAFLSSLGIRIQCERLTDAASAAFPRVLQLHQRTNTFNVATSFSRALTSDTLLAYVATANEKTHFALASTVTDRYGHYGLVCTALFRLVATDRLVKVESFVMSCRSLNRGVEHAMVKKIAEIALDVGANVIRVAWEPTVRNEPVRMFFASLSITTFEASSGGVEATTRAEKIKLSAGESGWWRLSTTDAMKISFLRDQQRQDDEEQSEKQHDTTLLTVSWHKRAQTTIMRLVRAFIQFVSKWMPRTWLLRLFTWFHRRITWRNLIKSAHQPGTSTLSFHSRGSLDVFMESRVRPEATRRRQLPPDVMDSPLNDETDEAFRLRVRHETKLLLLDHVAADTPRVVWAPHRSDDVRLDDDNDDDIDGEPHTSRAVSTASLQQFHRPCATPSCAAQVYWENACAFQRCRTCCYRVQRLLARASSDRVHAKARAHACSSLADDFNVSMEEIQVRDEWCPAHTNERRRK